jgi:hypothetical protein
MQSRYSANKIGNSQTFSLTAYAVRGLMEFGGNMAEQATNEQQETPEQVKAKRDKSSIQFAYLSLDEAVEIAVGVNAVGGMSCQLDQLAAHLGVKADTGSFRLRLGTSKLFGFVNISAGTVSLTPLGSRVCDTQQEQGARVEAFLNVPLYRQIHEQFKGGILPPPAGLEAAIVSMGVAPKQKTVARQVFVRSAGQAGFFAYGNNRLVAPAIRGVATGAAADSLPQTGGAPENIAEKTNNKGGGDGGGPQLHPFVKGLIETIPKPGESWPIEKRVKWLQAASHVFDLIFAEEIAVGLRIEIKVHKEAVQ